MVLLFCLFLSLPVAQTCCLRQQGGQLTGRAHLRRCCVLLVGIHLQARSAWDKGGFLLRTHRKEATRHGSIVVLASLCAEFQNFRRNVMRCARVVCVCE